MTYDPKDLRERSKEITNARTWGVGLITALLALGLFISEVRRIRALSLDLINYAYLAVFILSGVLIFLWIWSTEKELDLLFEWLDPQRYEPPSTLKETFLIIALAILLIGLLLASRNPMLFGSVFSAYSLVALFAGIYRDREIALAIDKSKERLRTDLDLGDQAVKKRAELYMAGINVLDSYFIRNPMALRSALIFLFSLLGLALAIWWRVTGSRSAAFLSYLVFFLIILSSEVVIGVWRNTRDTDLRPIKADLRELRRSEGSILSY